MSSCQVRPIDVVSEYRALGATGIRVSRVALGGMQASGWASSDDVSFVESIRHGLDMGVNFIDTAPGYGDGHSERLIARAIQGRRSAVVLATKFSVQHSRPSDIRVSLEASLHRLETDYVDLFQQHWPSPDVPVEDTIGELERLRDEGKIRAIGVSNWMEPEWEEVDQPWRIDALQPCYSLLWRSIEPQVLPVCRMYGVAVLPYSPLCQGLLTGRFKSLTDGFPDAPRQMNRRLEAEGLPAVARVVAVLARLSRKYEKTLAQIALRWLLDQPGITSVIVGSSSPSQIEENLGALGWTLEAADWRRLARVSSALSADLQPHDTLWGWHSRAPVAAS